MSYLIDTSIAIHARDGDPKILEKFGMLQGATYLSALTLVELQRGLHAKPDMTAIRQVRLRTMLQYLPVLPFDAAAATEYGQIIAALGWVRGRDFDRMIAAHALSKNCVMVTVNGADFADIPGLRIENWATP